MEEDYLWIGPSKCDEHRSAREKDFENIWNDLISTRGYNKTYILFIPAIDLFREAISCYQNGAYMATAIMCRASSETAVYCVITRKIKWRANLEIIQGMEVDHSFIEANFGEILCKAKASGYINGEVEQQLNEIREAGNFAAHYGQRYDRELITNVVKKEKIKGWMNREGAHQTLRKTTYILKALIEKVFDEYNALREPQH